MNWIKELPVWAAALPVVPKVIISLVILGVAALVLVLIWMPPPEKAVELILKNCYRRAVFTRTHAQINTDAMFKSIGECREIVQRQIPNIRRKQLQNTAVELLAALYEIERRNPIRSYDDQEAIDRLKLAALKSFRKLASATGGSYPLPERGRLGEASIITKQDADAALSSDDLKHQQPIA